MAPNTKINEVSLLFQLPPGNLNELVASGNSKNDNCHYHVTRNLQLIAPTEVDPSIISAPPSKNASDFDSDVYWEDESGSHTSGMTAAQMERKKAAIARVHFRIMLRRARLAELAQQPHDFSVNKIEESLKNDAKQRALTPLEPDEAASDEYWNENPSETKSNVARKIRASERCVAELRSDYWMQPASLHESGGTTADKLEQKREAVSRLNQTIRMMNCATNVTSIEKDPFNAQLLASVAPMEMTQNEVCTKNFWVW